MIEARQITVKKGDTVILQDVSLKLPAGKIVVIIGKNGAGKTTLLEAMTGSSPVLEGSVLLDKIPIPILKQKVLARRRAVLSQNIHVGFPLSVYQMIEMGTYSARNPLPHDQMNHLVYRALEAVDMLGFEERNFSTLSGGEQKRIMLAKCLAQLNCSQGRGKSQFLFLDEPSASLDVSQQYKLLDLIRRLVREQQIGVLAVIHDINLAAQFGDELVLMKDGHIYQTGSPQEILTPVLLKEVLDIQASVHQHPIFPCPHIVILPESSHSTPHSPTLPISTS
ncbi:MAG: heme ABC transporter ATP-binding protein [Bacteroidota bacterium]